MRVPPASVASARSSSSAPWAVTSAERPGPPWKASSTRTESGSANGYHLCQDAVNGIGMDECDLEPKEALPRLLVDQLGALGREPPELHEDILDLVGDMVHPRTVVCEEPADRRLLAEGGKQ